MKKTILFVLLIAFSLGIFGCTVAPEVDAETGVFQVGYAIREMMPAADLDGDGAVDRLPLGGYGNTAHRLADYSLIEDHDVLYTTCVAMTDRENNTVLMLSLDIINIYEPIAVAVRNEISTKTGIPKDKIFLNASHTHSAPDLTVDAKATRQFVNVIHKQSVEAALAALEDRKPVTGMYVGDTETEQMSFVRHIQQVDKKGNVTYCGDNFGTWLPVANLSARGFATQVDETMHVLQFTREDAPDVVMVNWRAHPTLTGGVLELLMSADYVGTFRQAMQERGYCFAFYQGGAGNVNGYHNIEVPHRLGTKTQQRAGYVRYGEILADHAEDALANAREVETDLIQTKQVQFTGQVDHSTDYLFDIARQVQIYWSQNGGDTDSRAQAAAIGKPYGIRSVYHAGAIVSRTSMWETTDLELNALTIGHSFAMTMAPNELFCGSTQWLEDQVAQLGLYEMTFTLGYSNDSLSYIPTQEAYDYTCYESDVTRFVPGTGELVQETFLEMLKELH